MSHPRGGAHYPRSVGEFQAWFRTDAHCLDYLEWLRWPDGFVCPDCGPGGWRLGDGGHDLRPDADSADGVVHRLLDVCLRQGRDVGAESAAGAGDRLVPDGLGDAAPAAVGAGTSGPGAVDREGGGG